MICQRCVFRARSLRSSYPRFISTSPSLYAEPISSPRGSASNSHEGPPAAVSSSVAQPFTASMTPSELPQKPAAATIERVRSSVQAGTAFKGLGYFKNKDPPIAMEDQEYPDWLWTLLDGTKKTTKDSAGEENDIYAKTKKMRRAARKAERKAAKAAEADPVASMPQVPLEHQTIDLPAGDGSVEGAMDASRARDELTVAMRRARRKSIKEGNFLKGMR